MTETMTGVLVFHSETGTEGGWYAFQDSKFMGLPAPSLWRCPRCGRVWEKDRDPEPPKPTFTYWPPAEEGYVYVGRSYGSPQDLPEGPAHQDPETGLDWRWNHRKNEISRICLTDGHAEFEHMYPNGVWSYEGLHMLKNGDHLRVFSKDKARVLWDGPVQLKGVESFTYDVKGFWVNQRPTLIDEAQWSEWFLGGYPAELTRKEES